MWLDVDAPVCISSRAQGKSLLNLVFISTNYYLHNIELISTREDSGCTSLFFLNNIDGLDSRGGEKRRQRGGETVALTAEHLMLHDERAAHTKAAHRADRHLERARDEVDFLARYVVELGDTTTGASDRGERHGLVDEDAILVHVLEIDHARQRTHVAVIQIDALDDEEAARGFGLFRILAVGLFLLFEQTFQVVDVVVLEVAHVAARGHDALLDGKVHALVGEYDVAAFRVGRYGARDGREAVRVDDALFDREEFRQTLFQLQVDIFYVGKFRRENNFIS